MHNLNQVLSSARYSTYTSCCILMFLVNFYEVKYSTTGWRVRIHCDSCILKIYIPEV